MTDQQFAIIGRPGLKETVALKNTIISYQLNTSLLILNYLFSKETVIQSSPTCLTHA